MLKDELELKPAAKATHIIEIRNRIRSIMNSFGSDGSGNKRTNRR
jgi:hypothetical protein